MPTDRLLEELRKRWNFVNRQITEVEDRNVNILSIEYTEVFYRDTWPLGVSGTGSKHGN